MLKDILIVVLSFFCFANLYFQIRDARAAKRAIMTLPPRPAK